MKHRNIDRYLRETKQYQVEYFIVKREMEEKKMGHTPMIK